MQSYAFKTLVKTDEEPEEVIAMLEESLADFGIPDAVVVQIPNEADSDTEE